MRKLRIFIVELILVGILVAWIYEKFPTAVDRFIPWIALAILWHLTWEIALEAEWTKQRARILLGRSGRMAWTAAFVIGGLISVIYFYAVQRGIGALTSSRPKTTNSVSITEDESGKTNDTLAREKQPPAAPSPTKALDNATTRHPVESQAHARDAKPPEPSDPRLQGDKPPTLSDLFNKDFPYTLKATMDGTVIHYSDDGVTIPIKRQVYLDFPGKSKFIGFYVPMVIPPNDRDNFEACLKLPTLVDQTFSDMNARTSVSGGFADQQESAQDLTFSGRVVLYHEAFLNITQKAAIIEAFKSKGYSVTFVGQDYLEAEISAWQQKHRKSN